jgi:hypothetical protein
MLLFFLSMLMLMLILVLTSLLPRFLRLHGLDAINVRIVRLWALGLVIVVTCCEGGFLLGTQALLLLFPNAELVDEGLDFFHEVGPLGLPVFALPVRDARYAHDF